MFDMYKEWNWEMNFVYSRNNTVLEGFILRFQSIIQELHVPGFPLYHGTTTLCIESWYYHPMYWIMVLPPYVLNHVASHWFLTFFPTQISSGLSPGKSAIPKKTAGVKNSVVGVQRRATFGYGDNVAGSGRGPSIERANKTTTSTTATPTSSTPTTDIRRLVHRLKWIHISTVS